MKKIFSILLICSLILLSTLSANAIDSNAEEKTYDLTELFADYEEKNFGEMVEFIADNPEVCYGLVEYFRNSIYSNYHQLVIHMGGEYNSYGDVWNAFATRVTSHCAKYLSWGTRPSNPDSYITSGSILVGEKGNKCFAVEIDEEFIIYINSLDYAEGNKMILNFLMNLIGDECVGVSFSLNYLIPGDDIYKPESYSNEPIIIGDCNRDGAVNSIDSYLIKISVVGLEGKIDPFAVDMNGDGVVNAIDSLALKMKIVMG